MERIELLQLEAWINRLRAGQPRDAVELSAPLQALAELYGRMIYARQTSVELSALTATQRQLLLALAAAAAPAGPR
ncbi:DUF3717 domain-containing protein [Duganella sp. BJB1802]|uniref:DUF3717 domain-containing protein n=1 Tax=Duganella sp. BJB1802 TaxID=2744575 RepID=UPI001594A116|nr:DUF3717 domain-containing protein [Duganella sp. BJB1802]NVD69572.1 DUF3717 domain-containing protein [Duganella sp. BJB1802]